MYIVCRVSLFVCLFVHLFARFELCVVVVVVCC